MNESAAAPESTEIDFTGLSPAMGPPTDPQIHRGEGYMRSWDDTIDLYWQSWEPEGKAHGVVTLMHGFGEHCGRYHHVAAAFCRAGYAVMAMDARGHGRSTGKRAHVDEYDQYTRDLGMCVSRAQERWPAVATFILGHSNGGLIALRHALLENQTINGYVLTSPFCGFRVHVPASKALAGRAMSRVWPSFTLPTELDPAALSHIDEVVERYRNDPLVLDIASARWFTETKQAQADTYERAPEIRQPFLWLVAGSDELADPRAAEEIYHRLGSPDREFEIFPDLFHEVLNETVWTDLTRQIIDWMERHRNES